MQKIKLILAGLLSLSALLFLVSPTKAQGTFTCRYIQQANACVLDQNNCTTGNTVEADSEGNIYCNSLSSTTCTQSNPHACVPVVAPQTGSPEQNINTYGCQVDRGQGLCVLATSGNDCINGFFSGSQCSTITNLGTCNNPTTRFPCTSVDNKGGENQACKPGNICGNSLYCDQNGGFICKKCGEEGQRCCPSPQLSCGGPSGLGSNSLVCGADNICNTGICGQNAYQGKPTYCATVLIPGSPTIAYSGCKEGESCLYNIKGIIDLGGSNGNSSPNDPFGACGENSIDTAIGCIPISTSASFAGFLLRWATIVGGGVSFVLIIFASFNIMTSAGDPQRLKGGQELLTSAIAGLVMLIFSIFILRLVGVSILQIPSF